MNKIDKNFSLQFQQSASRVITDQMRRLHSQSNIDIQNKSNSTPMKSSESSFNGSLGHFHEGKSLEKSSFQKFESFHRNISAHEADPDSGSVTPECKKQNLFSIPSLKIFPLDTKHQKRDKVIKQAVPESLKSQENSYLDESSTKNVIFYKHSEIKQVSLDQLKDKSSSYKRLQFKKKNQPRGCKKQDIEKIILTICKNAELQPKSGHLIHRKSQKFSEFQSAELIKQILHSASEVNMRPARKISFRQTSLKEPQLEDQKLKRITQTSFQHQNVSKLVNAPVCKLCGASAQLQPYQKPSKLSRKYQCLLALTVQLKKQYKKLSQEFLLFKQNLGNAIQELFAAEKNKQKLEGLNLQTQNAKMNCSNEIDNQRQNQIVSQYSDCYEFVQNLQQDLLLHEDVSMSSLSKNIQTKPICNQGSSRGGKIIKRENFRFNNDISFSSIRSVGKIVKNLKKEKNKKQQNFRTILDNQIKAFEKNLAANIGEGELNLDKNVMHSSGKAPQSPPTIQPITNMRIAQQNLILQINQQKERNPYFDQPLTSRNEQKLNFSRYSVSSSRYSKQQSKNCYANIQNALSRLKQNLL